MTSKRRILYTVTMQYVFGLLLLFMIGATLGWCLELVYRRFVSSKKWINPGFLNGPYLPLYGFGVCLLYGICSIPMPLWAQIVFIVVMMTVIEYIAGLIFIVGMHIKLWDYSKQWGNIQGIICPLYSLFWGALGVLFLFFVYPFLHHAVDWLAATPWFLFILGLFYGVMLIDVAVSFQFAVRLRRALAELKAAVRYEELKRRIHADRKAEHKRASFLFPFKTDKPIRAYLAEMVSGVKAAIHKKDKDTADDINEPQENHTTKE